MVGSPLSVDRRRGAWLDRTVGTGTLAAYAKHWLDERADLAPRTRDYCQRTLGRWVLPAVSTPRGRGVELGTFSLHALTTAVIRTWHAQVLAAARAGALERLERRDRPIHPARAWAVGQGLARRDRRPFERGDSGRLPAAALKGGRVSGARVRVSRASWSRRRH